MSHNQFSFEKKRFEMRDWMCLSFRRYGGIADNDAPGCQRGCRLNMARMCYLKHILMILTSRGRALPQF
jgi:hypothetical protein